MLRRYARLFANLMNARRNPLNESNKLFVLLIHFAFLLIGVGTIQLGVILPALAARLSLDDAQSGALSFGQYAGAITGTFLTSFLWRRFGFLPTFICGLILMAAGTCGLGFPASWLATVSFIYLNGIGLGITIPTANMLVAKLNPEKSAAALNILNFTWGIGALLCPSYYGSLGNLNNIDRPLFIFAVVLLITAFCFLPFAKMSLGKQTEEESDNPKSAIQNPKSIWLTSFAMLLAGILFLYVGVENSLGYWLTTYALRLEGTENTLFTAVMSVFWTAFLLGRLCAPLGLKRFSETKFILICLITAALGILIILAASNQIVLAIGAALAGAGLAPTFPTILAQFTTRFGEAAQSQVKWLFIISTCGGAAVTWLVGVVSKTSGDLRNGLFTTLACCVVMIVLQVFLIKTGQNTER